MKSSKMPTPPDPQATAAAQTASNRETAITQAGLNMVNQNTPEGRLSYNQIGTWADGTPRYEATTQLSPEQQALYGQQQQFDKQFNEIGLQQTQKIGGLLSKPLELGNEATEARLSELGRKRLDPMFAQQKQDLETSLFNRGIRPGTEAYDREMTRSQQGQNDAYNNLFLTGRNQAVQESLTERNQPINEITALMSGGQVQQPSFANTPNTGVNGTDVAGIINNNYQQQLSAAQMQNQNRNAGLGGLFGLGGTALGGWLSSDRRLKSDIKRVGEHRLGIGVYEYTINGARQRGVMSDEVRNVRPDAVRRVNGFDQVNYTMIGGV